MLNTSEWTSLVTVIVAMGGTWFAGHGVDSATLSEALGGGYAIVMIGWTLYHNWDTRRVPEKAIVTELAPTVAEAKALSIPEAK